MLLVKIHYKHKQLILQHKVLVLFNHFYNSTTCLTQAGQAQDVGGLQQFMGSGAGTGAGSIADFTSPFQQQVIDETLRQFDESRQAGLQKLEIKHYQTGAFGGGRQGALEGQFLADTALGRAGLEAQLRQQGFADAAARRQERLDNNKI